MNDKKRLIDNDVEQKLVERILALSTSGSPLCLDEIKLVMKL
jgi:hypothetical protein